jgi:RND family efflux transporter MFP subunit
MRVEDLQTQLARARAQRTLASSQFERFSRLAAARVLSDSQLDEVRAQRDIANEDVARAEEQLQQGKYEIDESAVCAPFPGVVTERLIQKGEYLQTGAATVRLVDTGDIEARATATLDLAGNVRRGQEVTLRGHGGERPGRVRAVVPVGDDRSRQFEVRVEFAGYEWLVGAPIEVSLPSTADRTAIVVPRDAVVIRQNRQYVLRVTSAGTVEEVNVTPGPVIGDMIQVSGLLDAGDRLVVRGAERLSAGNSVKIIDLTGRASRDRSDTARLQ